MQALTTYRIVLIGLIIFYSGTLRAQNMMIGENGNKPQSSAMLHINSTDKGLLIPRMNKAQRNAITDPAEGLMIYQTDGNKGIWMMDSIAGAWNRMLDSTQVAALILSLGADNLGDHTATQNIELDGNYLSDDGGNEGIQIASGGEVSITSNQTPQLHVEPKSTTGESGVLMISGARNTSTTVNNATVRFQNFDNDLGGYNLLGGISGRVTNHTTNVGDMVFYNYTDGSTSAETMRLKNTGRVGIGETSPDSKLHITATDNSGDITLEDTFPFIMLNSTSNSNAGIHFEASGTNEMEVYYNGASNRFVMNNLGAAGNEFNMTGDGNIGINQGSPTVEFQVDGGSDASLSGGGYIMTNAANTTNIVIDDNEIIARNNGAESELFINNDGGGITFQGGQAGGTEVVILDNGNVGMGTTTPSSKLHLEDDGDVVLNIIADSDNSNEADNPEIYLEQDGGIVNGFIGLEGNAGTKATNTLANAFLIGSEDGDPSVQIVTNDAARMTVLTNGRVGIGTTSPAEELEVNGNIIADEIQLTTGAANNKVLVSDASGNGSWDDVPSKTQTMMLPAHTWSNSVLQSGTSFGDYGWNYRYVEFDNSATEDLALSIMVPSQLSSNTVTMRVMYTSDVSGGNFRVFFATKAFSDGDGSIGDNPGGNSSTWSGPTAANQMKVFTRTFNTGGNDYMFLVFRRQGNDALDTSTGHLRILGVAIDYDN